MVLAIGSTCQRARLELVDSCHRLRIWGFEDDCNPVRGSFVLLKLGRNWLAEMADWIAGKAGCAP